MAIQWNIFQSAVAPWLDTAVEKEHADTAGIIADAYGIAIKQAVISLIPGSMITSTPPTTGIENAILNALDQIKDSENSPTPAMFATWAAETVLFWQSVQWSPMPPAPGYISPTSGVTVLTGGTPSPLDMGLYNAFDHSPSNDPMGDTVCGKLIEAFANHLLTVQGLYNGIIPSPAGPIPGPPFLWVGVGQPSPAAGAPVSQDTLKLMELIDSIPDDNNTVEGAKEAVLMTGTAELLDCDGRDPGPQIRLVKAQLKKLVPPNQAYASDATSIGKITPWPGGGIAIDCNVPFDYNAQISPNYKLSAVTIKAHFAHKIQGQFGRSVGDIVCNLQAVAINVLEPLRAEFGKFSINSGFRASASLKKGKISQHQKGEAVDIQFHNKSPLETLPVAEWIIANMEFDQLIFEHGNGIWLHISYRRDGKNRRSKLTMKGGKYTHGIRCHFNY